MNYEFAKHADKQLQKLPHKLQLRIIHKIKYYLATDNPLHFADSISGKKQALYRYRIGNYRVIFEIVKDTIKILKLKHRREAYKIN